MEIENFNYQYVEREISASFKCELTIEGFQIRTVRFDVNLSTVECICRDTLRGNLTVHRLTSNVIALIWNLKLQHFLHYTLRSELFAVIFNTTMLQNKQQTFSQNKRHLCGESSQNIQIPITSTMGLATKQRNQVFIFAGAPITMYRSDECSSSSRSPSCIILEWRVSTVWTRVSVRHPLLRRGHSTLWI